jgi:hypothetical protein
LFYKKKSNCRKRKSGIQPSIQCLCVLSRVNQTQLIIYVRPNLIRKLDRAWYDYFQVFPSYIYIYIYDDDHLKLHDDLNCEKNHEHLSMNQLLVILVASVKKKINLTQKFKLLDKI